MLKALRSATAFILCCSIYVYATGNTFKVRYNGGSVSSKVDPKDWGNKLTVTGDAITLDLKDGVKVDIPPKSVTSLSYGQEAHRRVGTMIALAVLIAPVALFGLFHKTRLHYIGIQYKTPDGKDAGILLQGDKEDYRGILVALQGVTGALVSVAEKEREFVPVGLTTNVTKSSESSADNKTSTPKALAEVSASSALLDISSTPAGADIEIDGKFVGSTPSSISVAPGDHDVVVKKAGFSAWQKKVSLSAGHITLSAELVAESK
jgi:PEGA domain-containing protein